MRRPVTSNQPVVGDASASASTITDPFDPRWVLAVRAAEQMNGAVLPLERRQRLIRLGRTMGLTPFDANMIIAIVQDQARRGRSADAAPAAARPQLDMIAPPQPSWGRRRSRAVIVAVAAIIALEPMIFM